MQPSGAGLIVVGVGRWGKNLAATAHSLGELTAIVDPDPDAVERLLAKNGALSNSARYRSLQAALDAHAGSAVVVATPVATHYAVARQALQHGRHVFVEKPVCDSLERAVELVELARDAGLLLMVDHLLHYSASHRRLIRLVHAGLLGRVTRVRMRRVNFGTVRTGENVLWSLCPHDVSIALALVARPAATTDKANGGDSNKKNGNNKQSRQSSIDEGDGDSNGPEKVWCHGQAVVSEGVHDYVDLGMSFHGGSTHVHIEAAWLHPERERRTVVYGTEGCATLNEAVGDERLPRLQLVRWSAERSADGASVNARKQSLDLDEFIADATTGDKGAAEAVRDGDFESDQQPLTEALRHFVSCVGSKTQPRTDGAEGVRVLSVLARASAALARGGAEEGGGKEEGRRPTHGIGENEGGRPEDSAATATATAMEVTAATDSTDAQSRGYFAHETAVVDAGARIGAGTKIWHFSHVMGGAVLGAGCNIGQNVYIGGAATLGANVKVQNNVSLYDAVTVGDDVFLGPSCMLTNVRTPRAHVSRKHEFAPTRIGRGVTVGANATVVCGVRLHEFCFVGAGAVVTKDVPAHALVYGNPARVQGWVSTTGVRLGEEGRDTASGRLRLRCGESGEVYELWEGGDDGEGEASVRRVLI